MSEEIIKKLRESDWCNCTTIPLSPANYIESFKIIEKHLSLCKYDLMLSCGDRIEMAGASCSAFHNNIKIAHLGAGIIDYSFVLFDDINRWCISLYADIAFCEDHASAIRLLKFWEDIGRNSVKEIQNVHIVGNFYEINEIDESLVPRYRYCDKCEIMRDCSEPNGIGCIEPYDLVLINAVTTKENKSTGRIESHFDSGLFGKDMDMSNTIWIGANPDFSIKSVPCTYYDNLPRPQFLGLLKQCKRFFTNSSCSYYEAPYFLKPEQIIQVGLRNKGRSTPKDLEIGASDKIVKILKEWWENEGNS